MAEPSIVLELREVWQRHLSARTQLRMLTITSRVLTALLVIVLLGSLGLLYGRVKEMYAPHRFEAPLQREARHLLPMLEPQVRVLWERTAPVYGELATEKIESALPEFQAAGRRELDLLLSELREHAETRIAAALDRVGRRHRHRLEDAFPTLADPHQADALILEWAASLDDDLGQVLAHFEARYLEDLGRLQATLEQFRPEDYEHATQDELIRQFVHLWLVKVDRWILLGETGQPLSVAVAEVLDGQ